MHMYSVAWDVLVVCTNHYLTETGGELGAAVAQMCGELCGGTVCGSCVGGAVGGLCGGAVFHSYLVSLIWFLHGLTEVFNMLLCGIFH